MAEEDNVRLAQEGYAAFGRGDIAGVLAICADDIEWVQPGPGDLPASGTYRGKAGVGDFFGRLAGAISFSRFEPYAFITQGDHVVALIHVAGSAIPSGKDFSSEDAHLFEMRDGKVVRFRVYTDTEAQATAYRGA